MVKGKIQIVFLFLLLFGWSCQGPIETHSSEKIVRINLGSEPQALDPRIARDPKSQTLIRMFFEGLTRIAPNDLPELAIAQSVEVSEDKKTYRFKLREANWSNGDPVTAKDFVYTWKTILSPDFPSDNSYQLYVLKNGKKVKEGILSSNELGVKAPDDYTLIVELEHPLPYALELFAAPFFHPVNEAIDQLNPRWAEKTETFVSNGPFMLKKWKHQDQILAKKNPEYWDSENLRIDGIEMVMLEDNTEMNLFEKGNLHWAGSPLSEIPVDSISFWKKRKPLFVQPRDETAFLRTNTDKIPLNYPKLRRALAMAINRENIVNYITQGGQHPALRLVPPSMQLQENPYFSDAGNQEAKKLFEEFLEETGYTLENLPKIRFTYVSGARRHLIAQTIQEQWYETLGLWIELEALESKVYFDRVSHHDFDLAFASWGADYHDPISFLEVFKYKFNSTNNTFWEDPKYQELLNHSLGLIHQPTRSQVLAECEKILMESMPIIPIYHLVMLYMKDEKLNGVYLSSLGNLDFKWASLDEE